MSTDNITVSSYDKNANKWADRLKKGKNLSHDFIEKPAMYNMIGNIEGKNILCIGCGSGEECEYLKNKGANVTGIDISPGMISVAKSEFPEIDFKVMDIENLNFENHLFDCVFASLVMHYLDDWTKSLNEIYRILKKGGTFIISTHHPVTHNSEILRDNDNSSYLLGYSKRFKDRSIRQYGDYYSIDKKEKIWPGNFKISFYNKPVSLMINKIISAGFTIESVSEPKPVVDALKINPEFYNIYTKLPLFFLIKARK